MLVREGRCLVINDQSAPKRVFSLLKWPVIKCGHLSQNGSLSQFVKCAAGWELGGGGGGASGTGKCNVFTWTGRHNHELATYSAEGRGGGLGGRESGTAEVEMGKGTTKQTKCEIHPIMV